MTKPSNFKPYKKIIIAEMRPCVKGEILSGEVIILKDDIDNGSPKVGDMIARNPKNESEQWLVSANSFKEQFTEIDKNQDIRNKLWKIVKTGDMDYDSILQSSDLLAIYEERIKNLKEHNAELKKQRDEVAQKAVDLFKDELIKSVNIMMRPHIEGVCAIIQERIKQLKSDNSY